MSLFSRLFGGGGSASEPEPEIYEDVTIHADPINEGGRYRLGARLEKEINGEVKTHMNKAKMVIDQQGDALFR
jgi:hypothetical protein